MNEILQEWEELKIKMEKDILDVYKNMEDDKLDIAIDEVYQNNMI